MPNRSRGATATATDRFASANGRGVATRPVRLAVAVLLTLALAWLHLNAHRHAGALWRDEVNSVNVVSMPTVQEVFAHVGYDSFPPVWIATLYVWRSLGLGDSDEEYRRIGLVIGLAMIGVAWWTTWRLGVGPPLVTLLLFGMSPSIIVYGDMVRGYGLAALAIVWSVGAMWAFIDSPGWRRYLVAQIAFVFAAQSHFANSVVLLAIGLGAAAVCWRRRDFRLLLATLGIGAVAAFLLIFVNQSNLAYMSSTAPQEQGGWRSFASLFQVFAEALAPGVAVMQVAWVVLPLAAAAGFVLAWTQRGSEVSRQRATFAAVTVAAGVAATFVAYKLTRLPTQYWHYLSLIAVCALACEVGVDILASSLRRGEWLRTASVAVLAVLAAPGVVPGTQVRLTNLDLVARSIEQSAGPDDLVVVFPWFCGITFQRYYRGPAPWITLPEMPRHDLHHHLVIREKMKLGEAAVAPELARVERTLRSGGRVWVVGAPLAPDPGSSLPVLPQPLGSGSAGAYLDNWEMQLGVLLESHAREGRRVMLPDDVAVNVWENPPLLLVEGWR